MRRYLHPTVDELQKSSGVVIVRTGLVAAGGFAIYGMTVGWWRSPLMGMYVAVKMPLLIAMTLGCNGLLNGLLGVLTGSGLGFRQSLHALLSAFAISGLILGSVAPVTLFLALILPGADSAGGPMAHSAQMLIQVGLIGLAGLAGVMRLRGLLIAFTGSAELAHGTLAAWVAGNAFLGAQFSWILRPFFGSPGLEVAFLRDRPMEGSFVEAVMSAAVRVGDREEIVHGGFFLAICVIAAMQAKHERGKRRP